MWLYYAHLYMSVLHCVFFSCFPRTCYHNLTYRLSSQVRWTMTIPDRKQPSFIGYIIYWFIVFVDMITSYLTNLVIIWRLYYITYIYNICTYMYICVYNIYIDIDQSSHSNIVWLVGQLRILARPVPPRSGSSNTPRDSKGFPCQFASRDPADHPSHTVLSKKSEFGQKLINMVYQWFVTMVYWWFVIGLSMVCEWFINGWSMVYQYGLSMVCDNGLSDCHCSISWTINGGIPTIMMAIVIIIVELSMAIVYQCLSSF